MLVLESRRAGLELVKEPIAVPGEWRTVGDLGDGLCSRAPRLAS